MNRPWMPLYVADYLADTAHLSAAESGAYLHLIMHYWLKGGLPNDHAQLAKITRMSLKLFNRSVPVLAPFFGPNWSHKRINQELEKTKELSEKRRSAVAQRKDRCSTIEPTIVDQLNTHSHSHSQIDKSISTPPPKKAVVEKGDFDLFYETYPRKIGKEAARKSYARAILKIAPAELQKAAETYRRLRTGQDDKFTPHPATWLNQGRWDDDDLKKTQLTVDNLAKKGIMPSRNFV
jgi:uncharacterized protein YdaU (DUF1376 family)